MGSAVLLAACNKASNQTTSAPAGNQTAAGSQSQNQAGAAVIVYGDKGFEPASLNAKVGQAIIIMNSSKNAIQFNSDPHPAHSSFPELNLGAIGANDSKTLTITKAGTYTYHNHLNPSQKGTITVE